jgi:hypothetical protein
MLTVDVVDCSSKAQVNEFVRFHYDLYQGTPQWVPPFKNDVKLMLNREKHPFFEHSEGEFFIAKRDGKVVGRLAMLENKPFNQYHQSKKAQFYLFDSINDIEVARALFVRGFEWCKKRGLESVVGPKGLSALDGYGVQVEGYEHRQMMTMMNYNFPYYQALFEGMGFHKENEFISAHLTRDNFFIPEKMFEVARRVAERGKFRVVNFTNRREMLSYTKQIGIAYNKAFVNNWEYYPLSEREVKFTVDNILFAAVPQYIKLIAYNEDVVGFLLGFPDVSAALQRQKGNLTPWGIADMLLELRKTKFISLNGVGVLPEYQGRGGNALMYQEMAKVLQQSQFIEGELTQMADTATQVRKDVITAGAEVWKRHRIFAIDL